MSQTLMKSERLRKRLVEIFDWREESKQLR